MKLKDLLLELRYGELANSPFVCFNGDSFIKRDIPKIIIAINATLNHLSNTFMIFKDKCIIATNSYCTEYELNSDFALSNTESPVPQNHRFIVDSPISPFEDNVIKICNVYDATGRLIILQDYSIVDSVYLTSPTTLILPNENGKLFTVEYFAKPREIPITESEYSEWEVSLPQAFKSAFKAYLLYKLYSLLNTDKGIQLSNSYFQQFQFESRNLIMSNVAQNDYVPTSVRPLEGWV